MNDLENRRIDMMTRVRDFGAAHAADFPPSSFGGEQFAIVASVVAELSQGAAAQASGTSSIQQATTSRAVARAAVREDVQAIASTARVIALDTPGLEDRFRLPRSGGDQSLLATARAFHADAAPLKAQFLRHELPADFLEDLAADIEDLERAISDQNTNKGASLSAGATIDTAIERGLDAVQRLHAIVRNKFRQNPAILAAWESARHTQRPTRRARPAAGNTNPPAPGTTPAPGDADASAHETPPSNSPASTGGN